RGCERVGARRELTMDARPPDAERRAALLRRHVEQGPTWLPVAGESRGRTIRSGSEVLVVASRRPRLGEVWAFCNAAGMLVVHRFRRRRGGLLYFQGDAHWPDPPVECELLVGRVVCVREQGRERPLGWQDRLRGGARLVCRGGA